MFANFLLSMRESSERDSCSLQDQFAGFLEKLGIYVTFEDEEIEEDEAGNVRVRPEDENKHSEPIAGNGSKRIRRASFNEIEDSIDGVMSSGAFSKLQLPPRSKSQNEVYQTANCGQKTGLRKPDASRMKSYPPRNGPRSQSPPRLKNEDLRGGKKPVVQIREEPSIYEFEDSIASEEASETDEVNTQIEEQHQEPAKSNGYGDDLETNARSVRYRKLAARAHGIFHDWQRKATERKANRNTMLSQALDLDYRALAKQAFDQWHDRLSGRRSEKTTEAFFQGLENRAGRARDSFLLTKAFTHWAQATSDEIVRTSAARRHILRTRYFNAWQDITVINELKVRRQGLSKFVKSWRLRNAQVTGLNKIASGFRASELRAKSYRDWFWEFCDRRAPSRHNTRTQVRCLDQWAHQSYGHTLRNQWSSRYAQLHVLRKSFTIWRTRSQIIQKHHVDATKLQERLLLAQTIRAISQSSAYRGPFKKMARIRNSVLSENAFQLWLAQTRSVLVAQRAYRSRIMRTVWMKWNDKLRCRVLSYRISDRIIMQALYKWIIAERLKLFERVAIERWMRRTFTRWKQRMLGLCSSLGQSEHSTTLAKDNRSKQHMLKLWQRQAVHRTQDRRTATGFHKQKTLRRFFDAWQQRKQKVEQFTSLSHRAELLVLTSPVIKKWQDKLEATKKKRRRDGFAIVRTQQKTKLLRMTWDQLANTRNNNLQKRLKAVDRHELNILSKVFGAWRSRANDLQFENDRARNKYRVNLLVKTRATILERQETLHLRYNQAEELLVERLKMPTAIEALRKLRRYSFQMNAHNETAGMLQKKNTEKHFRFILRHLSEKAQEQRRSRLGRLSKAASSNKQEDDNTTQFTADASRNDVGLGVAVVGTPAYLRTPSRRTTGRLKMKVSGPPITPGPAYITPFMNRIKAQYPSGLPRTIGESRGQRGNAWREVEGIPENSPVCDIEE